jgi:hypothetical protein
MNRIPAKEPTPLECGSKLPLSSLLRTQTGSFGMRWLDTALLALTPDIRHRKQPRKASASPKTG